MNERELRRGCLQFPSNFVGNIVTPRSYHLVYGLIPRCRSIPGGARLVTYHELVRHFIIAEAARYRG